MFVSRLSNVVYVPALVVGNIDHISNSTIIADGNTRNIRFNVVGSICTLTIISLANEFPNCWCVVLYAVVPTANVVLAYTSIALTIIKYIDKIIIQLVRDSVMFYSEFR